MTLPNGITDLMLAASRGDLARVETLLAAGVETLDAQDAFGQTALSYAASAGHAHIIAALVMAGADVTLRNRAGFTGLEIASAKGHTAAAQMLRQAHLCAAARDGDLALLAQMLDAGADINAQLADGWTALMIAAYHDQPAAVRALLSHGADAALQTDTGRTARSIALGLSHQECYRLLTNNATRALSSDEPPTSDDVTDFADAAHPEN